MYLQLTALAPLALAFVSPPSAAPQAERVSAAVVKSLPLLEKGAIGHRENRQCFACHNQALPLLGLTTARAHGFRVNDGEVQKQLEFIADFLGRNRANFLKGQGTGGQADTAGYALFTLDVGGWKADATTEAVAEYLLLRDKESSHWRTVSRRPPSEASSFTTTYLALRGLRKYATPKQRDRVQARTDSARSWLLRTTAVDTEDRVFRLQALRMAGAEDRDVLEAVRELARTQRPDGGWAQTDKLDSDAYATGSALVTLHQVGGLSVRDAAYRRGVSFLLGAQLADGSWKVASRSKPFQTYFESGFPHGKDQFISIAASGWATAALALACPPGERDATKPERLRLPNVAE